MRFWLSLVSVREQMQLPAIARLAESAGFHGIMVGDHLLWPARIETPYPYSPDGKLFLPADTPWPDPWVLFAHLGAVTRKLHFASNIYLAALRDPFTAAKAVATAALLTEGRVVCGVSAGWLKEEFDLTGVDFGSRGGRLDETLTVMRKLWSGTTVSHSGERYRFEGTQCPAPPRPVRIWCGGDSPAAMRRAARNDGWLPIPMTLTQAAGAIEKIRRLRSDAGLPMEGFQVVLPLAQPLTAATLEGARGLGVEDLVVLAPWLQSPWDTERWLAEGEDPSDLDVKQRVLDRFKSRVLDAHR
jgi:probable F420-dependent oxidoreductase